MPACSAFTTVTTPSILLHTTGSSDTMTGQQSILCPVHSLDAGVGPPRRTLRDTGLPRPPHPHFLFTNSRKCVRLFQPPANNCFTSPLSLSLSLSHSRSSSLRFRWVCLKSLWRAPSYHPSVVMDRKYLGSCQSGGSLE